MVGSELQSIGKYSIKSILGHGAMGVVYRGYDPNIARDVAIKTIHKSLLATEIGQELLQRFRNEAQAVGRLGHPNIVSIFEFDSQNGMPFFVMELVEGKELKDYFRQGRKFTPEEIIRIGSEILDGLSYTHGLGIIHRDIKPANIFVLNDGSIKIADFGIARVDNSELTQMGSVLGTPSYMSPEQCVGGKIDVRSDLFSVGVLLYEMLCGEKPFQGDNSNTIMLSVVNSSPKKTSAVNPALSRTFDALIRKALSKKPSQRYQNAAEFKTDLQACLEVRAAGVHKGGIVAVIVGLMAACVALGLWYNASNDAIGPRYEHAQSSPLVDSNSLAPAQQRAILVSDADALKVERLLKVARAHALVGRLVSPQGSNAHDAYQLVLTLDPGNVKAIKGLQSVAETLFARAQAVIAEGNDVESNRHLNVALQLFPQHAGLLGLRASLE